MSRRILIPILLAPAALGAVLWLVTAGASWLWVSWMPDEAVAILVVALPALVFALVLAVDLRWGLLALLVARPLVDTLRDTGVGFTERFATLNLAGVLTIAVVAFTALLVVAGRIQVRKLRLLPPGGLLLILLATGPLAAGQLSPYFLADYLRLASLVSVYVLSANVFAHPGGLRQLSATLHAAAILPMVLAAFQLLTGSGQQTDSAGRLLGVQPTGEVVRADIAFMRVFGTFEAPGVFGMFLLISLALCLARWPSLRGGRKAVLAVWLGLVAGAVFFTFSRAAWVGALMVLCLIAVARRSWLLLAAGLSLAVLLALLAPTAAERLLDSVSMRDRQYLWAAALSQLSSWREALIGRGLGSWFELSLAGYGRRVEAHNDYLRLLIESGVWGLGLYLWVMLSMLVRAAHAFRSSADHFHREVALGFAALLAALLAASFTDNISRHLVLQMYVWALAGALEAAEAGRRRQAALTAAVARGGGGAHLPESAAALPASLS